MEFLSTLIGIYDDQCEVCGLRSNYGEDLLMFGIYLFGRLERLRRSPSSCTGAGTIRFFEMLSEWHRATSKLMGSGLGQPYTEVTGAIVECHQKAFELLKVVNDEVGMVSYFRETREELIGKYGAKVHEKLTNPGRPVPWPSDGLTNCPL